MIDVLLTHSYHLFFDAKQAHKMQPYPPLGTLYAAALLRQHGFSVALFDTMIEDPQTFTAALARHKPRAVAIYEDSFNFLSKMCLTRMREVAYAMVEEAKAAGCLVLANGSDSSDHVDEYLQRGCDFVLLGEGEQTLLDLMRSIRGDDGAADAIPGLAFVDPQSDEVRRTAIRRPVQDLDGLPLPARDLVDTGRYRRLWREAHGCFSLNIVASRGCPFHCNWCAKPIYGTTYHTRSPQSVAEEVRILKRDFGAEHIWYADDIFALKPRWCVELAQEVKRLDAVIPFKIQARVDLLTAEAVNALRSAGCSEVWLGVESGSQKILDAMEKGTELCDIERARTLLRNNGIRACFFLQFGYPGESWAEIQETISMVRRTRPDDIGVSVAYPLPGTGFYDRVREELGAKRNWVDSADLSAMFRATYRSDFYRALRDALHAEVASWQSSELSGQQFSGVNHETRPAQLARLWSVVERMEAMSRNLGPQMASASTI
jgi:radical SAM superfamily enzyme YgiQ (UPF0313 family)